MNLMINLESKQDFFNDAAYWKAFIGGDRNALELIYRRYIQDLFRFGCSLLQDREQIKDLIQEVFIDLWKYHSNLQETDNVKNYLFKCLSNKIYKVSKDEARRRSVMEEHTAGLSFVFDSPESEMINLQRDESIKKKLHEAIVGLPIRQKEVIHHLFFDHLSYEQTSALMNINLKSVYTLAWKAISSLKKTV
ncbi:RNA polymerase sigma factor (sigma-70 family) [Algoriphagus iocasae]|uniref:RNA polymerase sigma factor (Sigma-70 family) n=2 Tax=Algoriphagus iocasae TaxID=1836499 RepID=A0A841MXS2_9BACT|nr:RNA polymerase sigma factor (sigma-70 family) [Algoriphagus iocasae]